MMLVSNELFLMHLATLSFKLSRDGANAAFRQDLPKRKEIYG